MKTDGQTRYIITTLITTLVIAMVGFSFGVTNSFAENATPKAKNIIIFIGDGMGFNGDLAGTYYRFGEAGKQRYHAFPVYLGCTTYCMAKKDAAIPDDCMGYDPEVFWISPAYGNQGTEYTRTTDSAAAATALFGGQKTIPGKIGLTSDDKPVELISEIAAKLGKKVGSVTTAPISHATPAGFAAHESSRGRMDKVFIQMAGKDSPLSVLMGCGNPLFEHGKPIKVKDDEKEKDRTRRFLLVGGEETWEPLQKGSYNGFTVLQEQKQFENLATKTGDIPEKVIGLPRSNSYLCPTGANLDDLPETDEKLRKSYKNRVWEEIPSLETMTLGAINVLTKNNDKGFVLMVEGGAIDRANHGQKIDCNCFEHAAFSKTIDATIDWIEKNSSWEETLVIITMDHETGQLWGPESYSDDNENDVFDEGDVFDTFQPLENNGRGKFPEVQYAGKGHSNALVPLWAKGPGAELFLKRIKGNDKKAAEYWKFSGDYVDNVDVFHVMKSVLVP